MAFSCFSVIFMSFYSRPAPYLAQCWLYSAARLPFAKLAVCCISLAVGHIWLFYPAQRVRPFSTVSVRTAFGSLHLNFCVLSFYLRGLLQPTLLSASWCPPPFTLFWTCGFIPHSSLSPQPPPLPRTPALFHRSSRNHSPMCNTSSTSSLCPFSSAAQC
jgi:hypothetical protein